MASLNSAPTAPAASRPVALNYQLTTALPRVSNDRDPAEKPSFHLPFPPKGTVYFERARARTMRELGKCATRDILSCPRTWFALSVTHQQESNFESISTRWMDFSDFDKRGNVVHRLIDLCFRSCDVSNWVDCGFVCEFRYAKWILRMCIVMIIIR